VLVAVTGFGSVWRHRRERYDERGRIDQPVYYNTTGVLVNGKFRQCPQICGYARFDTVGGFDPNCLSRMLNRVFECAQPSVWMGCNRLLFRRILEKRERPDRFLIVTRSDLVGQLSVGEEAWRSPESWLLSFTECGGRQETLLLMPAGGWIRSSLGLFILEASQARPVLARLALRAGE
jgi:hypothetical protein